jgi:adenosylcobinamide kinase/adenosylcobinamide-phosphate guanylyltransferase
VTAGEVAREDVMVAPGQVALVLGGTRSGKSAAAERLAAAQAGPGAGCVTYVATGPPATGGTSDPQWQARVAAHRARRPEGWVTAEVTGSGLLGVLSAVDGVALVDSLGAWISSFEEFAAPAGELCGVLAARAGSGRPTVVVSEEVGLGVHPPTEVGRRFADALGTLNQAVAEVADRVLLVVAGRVIAVERTAT